MAKAAITLTKLEKTYDNGFVAVRGIDLHIRDREFMVLVGPSGCGKTTTLRMIAGLEDISGGTIAIGDRVVNAIEPKDRDIAMVFQNYALYPHMTVFENMAYGLTLRRMPKAEIRAKVERVATLLDLTTNLSKLPKQLSGGQRQRVALGRAIVRQPAVFLFDEPLSNLDAKLRGDMRYELKKLQQHLQTTTVYVTHDQIEAMTLGDRITVMSQGDIQQVAAPTTLYDWPYNRFVAEFIGTPPMNFLTVTLGRSGEQPTATLADGTTLPLWCQHVERLMQTAPGTQVVLGVRPEHFAHGDHVSPTPSMTRVHWPVSLIEVMGDHQYVYLTAPGSERALIMKCNSHHRCAVGSTIPVLIDTAVAQVFADASAHAANLTLPPDFPRHQ